jgi:hypothetical protein
MRSRAIAQAGGIAIPTAHSGIGYGTAQFRDRGQAAPFERA